MSQPLIANQPPAATIESSVEVLVTVEHADGIAAIARDKHEDGVLWLAGHVDEPTTELRGHLPAAEPLSDDRTVQGGRLPAGAVGATVVDDLGRRWRAAVGGGAWLVVVDQPIGFGLGLPVRFLDADGETVVRPLPPNSARTPVDDAPEPCPACGAGGWDHVRPRDVAGRGAPGSVVCRACGHEEAIGMALADPAPAAPRAPRRPQALPDGLSLPVYACPALGPRLAGWVGDGRSVFAVGVDHGSGPVLGVETRRAEDEPTGDTVLVRQALEDALADRERRPERSPAGLAVWLRTRDRRVRQIAARAPLTTHSVLLDGRPEPFLVVAAGGAWAAVRRHGGLIVILTARGQRLDDVALERLEDPARSLG